MPGRHVLGWCALVTALALAGCSRDLTSVLAPNQPPEVKVRGIAAPSTPDAFAWQVRWTGTDVDGRISHYLVALDPKSIDRVDATWRRVEATEEVVSFPTRAALRRLAGVESFRPHVLAVRAVDDRGEISDPAWFAFGEGNIPPSVEILSPRPSSIFTPVVYPTVTIHWAGIDPDGVFTQKPVKYKYRLFTRNNPDRPDIPDFISWARANPDSLRALYAPKFSSWDSTSGDTTETTYTDLVPQQRYLFAITAFDEAGDYDPVFSNEKNLLAFDVTFEGAAGPVLTMFNESFSFTYLSGGFSTAPGRVVRVGMPADQPITFNWFGIPSEGDVINAYRWVLDPVDIHDETPRIDENDLSHWSPWSLATTSATLPPLPPTVGGAVHRFYIEARTINGLVSLGILEFGTVQATLARNLLIVDDTRLAPDMFIGGALEPPRGEWPTAAELDTFLYAIGGNPWQGYPAGTNSPDGVISRAYDYDTLGTRGLDNRSGIVSAGILGQYRHVIWITDPLGATYTGNPHDPVRPMTMLRRMTQPGQSNQLATYVEMGGKVWIAGGGAAYASLISWNRNGTSNGVYSAADNELVPGRMMYDHAHWRSEITMLQGTGVIRRTETPGRGWPGQPDYSRFPEVLNRRSASSDPLPPLRAAPQFYLGSFFAEFLSEPNEVLKGGASVLDSLAETSIGGVFRPVMTYYHGSENGSVVFSGFDLWAWRRTQCKALIDFVLQDVWGMPAPNPAKTPRRGPTRVTGVTRDDRVATRR